MYYRNKFGFNEQQNGISYQLQKQSSYINRKQKKICQLWVRLDELEKIVLYVLLIDAAVAGIFCFDERQNGF